MLLEAMIKIEPDVQKKIHTFFEELAAYMSDLGLRKTAGIVSYMNYFAQTKEFPKNIDEKLSIEFVYDRTIERGRATFSSVRGQCKIKINLVQFVEFKQGIPHILYNRMMAAFIHEFVHYEQWKRRKNKGIATTIPSDEKGYFSHPFEQQAWAAEYVQYLKSQFKFIKPEQVLRHLKNTGLMHDPSLRRLKTTNPQAWKSVMKNAIMSSVADLYDINQLPWQQRRLP